MALPKEIKRTQEGLYILSDVDAVIEIFVLKNNKYEEVYIYNLEVATESREQEQGVRIVHEGAGVALLFCEIVVLHQRRWFLRLATFELVLYQFPVRVRRSRIGV